MQLPYGNVPANFAAVAMQGEIQVERSKLNKEKQALERLEDKQHIYGMSCCVILLNRNTLCYIFHYLVALTASRSYL